MQAQRPALVAEQRQKLNPRMLQSIKILAMPVAELTEEIQSELEANPALEVLDDRSELSLDSYAEAKIDDSGEDWGDGTEDYSYRRTGADEDAKHKFLEGAIALPETLQEHLLTQLRMLSLSPVIRKIGEHLIQNLDEDGFHRTPPEELCPACSPEDLEQAIEIVRGLDPNGTCTKDYRESLLVQAALDPEAPEGVIEIMTAHLDKLEKGKHAEIRRSLKIKDPQIEEILAYIKTLSPFPGRAFSTEKTRYVVPDLAIRVENDEFVIELNDEVIPLLGINPFFSELSSKKSGPRDKDTVSFVKENIERAKFFIGSLQQRSQTLLKVAKVIAKFQARFFVEGPQAMQPLTLRDVADEVGCTRRRFPESPTANMFRPTGAFWNSAVFSPIRYPPRRRARRSTPRRAQRPRSGRFWRGRTGTSPPTPTGSLWIFSPDGALRLPAVRWRNIAASWIWIRPSAAENIDGAGYSPAYPLKEAHMNIDVRSVHFDLSEESKKYLATKIERIGYAKDMIVDLLFVFTKDSKNYKLEVTTNFRWGLQAHLQEKAFEINPGIDALIEKLDQKIAKEKQKIQSKK